ncbi:MAG: hypothetical protein HY306_04465 [Nitrosomonadales bacterium]|nr:hypothetical protein [Nitrosomonadales bacterium]
MVNRSPHKRFLRVMPHILAALVASGCQSPPSDIASSHQPVAGTEIRQLIAKFKPHTITCDAAGIAQLSSATGMAVEHVRPMSGDACVIKLQGSSEEDISRRVELLRRNPAVEWLELDAKKKAL